MDKRIISIEGNIGSGKSFLLEKLKKQLSNRLDVLFIDEPLSEWLLIKDNNLGDIKISLKSIIYKGNKFDIESGKYIVKQDFENYINCGIFVLAILETYDLKILDWTNWPKVSEFNKNEFDTIC